MIANGLYDLDASQLAALVTYLRHDLTEPLPDAPWPRTLELQRLGASDLSRYRAVFRAVGEEWLWFSRLRLAERDLRKILVDENVLAHAVVGPSGDLGLLELDFRDENAPELAFFGVVVGQVGAGLGRNMIAQALRMARKRKARCLYVHTCSLDHPRAQTFYQKAGFKPYRRAVEICRDPRLDGTLPHHVARQIPLLENSES